MVNDQEVEKSLMHMKIIWFAMLISLAIYLLIGILAGPNIRLSIDQEMLGMLRMIFYVLSFIALIAAGFVRNVILTRRDQTIPTREISGQTALQRYQTATVVSLAMSEFVGICGLVAFFLGKSSTDLYILIAVSAAAMFIYRPNKVDLINLMQEQRRV